VTYED